MLVLKKPSKCIKLIILFFLVSLIGTLTTYAVSTLTGGFYGKKITIQNHISPNYFIYMTDGLNNAVDTWNSADIYPRSIEVNTTSSNGYYWDNFLDPLFSGHQNALGLYHDISSTDNCPCHTTLIFNIFINTRTVEETMAESVAAHELGHALGLADNKSNIESEKNQLMHNSRDREVIVGPTPSEALAVSSYWRQYHGRD